MPLTPFQRGVAQILAKHRNPESHVAGGAVINRGEGGVRISDDLDIFHDLAASVAEEHYGEWRATWEGEEDDEDGAESRSE